MRQRMIESLGGVLYDLIKSGKLKEEQALKLGEGRLGRKPTAEEARLARRAFETVLEEGISKEEFIEKIRRALERDRRQD